MLFNRRLNRCINHSVLFNVCAVYILVSIVSGHRCYICGPEGNVPSCDNFDPTNENLFAKECPESSVGCSLQKYDTYIVRSCEDIKLKDCKEANTVVYCYCTTNLCNADKVIHETKTNAPSDDEDMNEGSGDGNILNETKTPSTESEPETASKGVSLHGTLTLVLASILL